LAEIEGKNSGRYEIASSSNLIQDKNSDFAPTFYKQGVDIFFG